MSPLTFGSEGFGVRREGGRDKADTVRRELLFGRFEGERSIVIRRAPVVAPPPSVDMPEALILSGFLVLGDNCGIMLERRRGRSPRTGPMLDRRLPFLPAPTTFGVTALRFAGLP